MSDVIPNWLEQRAQTNPEHAALIYNGRAISYADLAARTAVACGRLHRLGVRRGDRVALLLAGGPEFAAILHALPYLGAVAVPLNRRLSPVEIARQLADSGPRLLVYDRTARETVAAVRRHLLLFAASADVDALDDDPVFDDVSAEPDAGGARIDLQAVHSIIYTSGSTGHPRGVLLTYGNFFWSAVGSAFNLGVHRDDRWLACLPFCHVGGLSILLRSVIYGTTVVTHDGFDAAQVDRALDEERVTIVSVVANMLQRLLERRGNRPYPSWLRCVLLGGGPAPLALLQACRARGVPVVQTYGLTEAASQVTTLAPADADRKLGSAGKPLLGTEIALSGPNGPGPNGPRPNGPVPADAVGEILVRGPTVSPGYLDPADNVHREDGWLRTGDLGRLDAEGFLYVMGRHDDMIITGGENVYPAEVEAVLQGHLAVAEACVFGVSDARWGQAVAAGVRLRVGATATPSELIEYVCQHLARFKAPRRIHFVEDFPRTASGKIIREQVREQCRNSVDGLS
ncbi:MAG: o-succinylbenzoate--CoA ligase [Candidatus Binatia bacterium]|jgi:o-succinylbenzoate---CoA ligase